MAYRVVPQGRLPRVKRPGHWPYGLKWSSLDGNIARKESTKSITQRWSNRNPIKYTVAFTHTSVVQRAMASVQTAFCVTVSNLACSRWPGRFRIQDTCCAELNILLMFSESRHRFATLHTILLDLCSTPTQDFHPLPWIFVKASVGISRNYLTRTTAPQFVPLTRTLSNGIHCPKVKLSLFLKRHARITSYSDSLSSLRSQNITLFSAAWYQPDLSTYFVDASSESLHQQIQGALPQDKLLVPWELFQQTEIQMIEEGRV